MGDRTSATLVIFGEVRRDLIPQLVTMIDRPDDIEDVEFQDGAAVRVECEEVNYGSMASEFGDELQKFLEANGISYTWSWGAGAEYGPGFSVWTPEFGGDFETNGDEIVVPVRQLGDAEVMERARKAQKFWEADPNIKIVDPAPPASGA